jgi:hypothetical protein
MASRQIKMPAKNNEAEQKAEEVFSQSKRPERGRYLLQVDRQTKNSYTTSEAAQSVALAIKTGYPIVQVSVYDSVEHTHTHDGSGTGSVFLTNLLCLPHCSMSALPPKAGRHVRFVPKANSCIAAIFLPSSWLRG